VATDAVIWDPVETLPREQLRTLQFERLRATIDRVLTAQPLGAQRLRDSGLSASGDLTSLDDLRRLAFMLKTDLRAQYPYGLIAVPREELVRVHASSGTHGKPTVVAYTRADLDGWSDLMARSMTMAGVRPSMTIHNANGYGLFTGGLGFHQGGERIGANVVPVSGGRTARQAMLIRDLEPEVLVSSPSYALVVAQALSDGGTGSDQLSLQLGLFGGEPWGERMREQIEAALGLKAVAFYGLSEMCGPGVATECLTVRDGLHVQEDHFLVEVIDPASGHVLPPGQEGELVFTTLTKEALPLVRYRTGDLGTLIAQPCPCGRTLTRIAGLRGRQDDMLVIRGVNLYPSEVEHVLLSIGGAAPHYRLIVERPGPMDEITVECEAGDGADPELLRARAEKQLKEHTGLRMTVKVVEAGAVPRSEGKAVRVLDRREL
jgi:phenylacetate-CoA ligase